MRSLDMHFDQVTASPAARVKETLESVETGYGAPLDPHFDRRIYLASAETLMDVIHDPPDNADTMLLVGHNPGLEELVLLLVRSEEHTSELQSLMRLSYAVLSLKKKKEQHTTTLTRVTITP